MLVEAFTRDQSLRKLLLNAGALPLLLQVAFRTSQASVRLIALQCVLALAKSARAKSILLRSVNSGAPARSPAHDIVDCLVAAPASLDARTNEADEDARCKLTAVRCLAQLSWGEESGSAMAQAAELVKGLVQVTMHLCTNTTKHVLMLHVH